MYSGITIYVGKVDEERAHQKIGGASVINRGEQRYFDNFKQNQFRFASYSDPAIQNDLNYRDELKDEEKDSNISIVENQLRFNERPSHLDYRLEDSANESKDFGFCFENYSLVIFLLYILNSDRFYALILV